jgi:glycosyltransferase involved in cell wall biosynthesis
MKAQRLAVDLRELRRPGTGIGRWTRNFLGVREKLAPDVPVLGIGAWTDELAAAIQAPSWPWLGARLNPLLERERAGLWLSPFYKLPPGLSIPAFVTVHDTIPATIPHRRPYFTVRLMHAVKAADRVVTVSEVSRADLIENWGVSPEKILLARNAVGARFSPEPASDEAGVLRACGLEPRGYLLVVSDDRPHKNLATLIDAFAGRDLPPVICVGTKRDDLPAPLRRLSVLDDDKLAVLYRNAAALLHPALQEGFGLPPLEAMACGTAVILSDIPPLREIAGNTARYVPPLDHDAWRAAAADLPSAEGVLDRARIFRAESTYADLWAAIRDRVANPTT